MSDVCWLIISSRPGALQHAELCGGTVTSACALSLRAGIKWLVFLPRLSNNSFLKRHFRTHWLFPRP